ncbi:MAG TPA: hypothetical protein VIO11_10405 [Candidatus Methanoperedens sp.]
MDCKKVFIIIVIITFLVFPVPSSALDNGYARIVYNVRGLQDYDLHWNDRFPQGSMIKIYSEANGVNHRRAVGVDYVFIIKDSNDNIVDTASYSNRYDDYRENDFTAYSVEIPSNWDDGVYNAEVHIFDLLNDTIMTKYYEDVTQSYLNGSTKPDIPYMSRGDVLNLTETERHKQLINLTKTFYIDKYAVKYPIDRFRIENIMLDRKSVAPKDTVQVSANVVNTFYDRGSTSLSLLLDNISVDNATLEIDGYSSRLYSFNVSSDVIGNHTVEIIPTGNDTQGMNLAATFAVSLEKMVELPTTFDFQDIRIDNLSVLPNTTVVITVTVENKGQDGSQPVELFINDVLEETKDVYLNFSETRGIKFNVTKAELGAYRVKVDNSSLSKVFFVESAAPPEPVSTVTAPIEKVPHLKLIIGLSILVIFINILRIYLKRKLK